MTSFLGAGIPLFTTILALAVFVCSAFAAGAGCVVMALYLKGDFIEAPGFFARLAAKTALLTLLAVSAGWRVRRAAPLCLRNGLSEHDEPRATSWTFAVLFIAFALSMLLVLPNLSAYPWPAPDETHHLIVARNLAEHGAYASGHPDDAFTYFDPYDSVGAPVILPVAAVFSLNGTGLAGARIVIAFSYLILCVLVFLVMRRPFGPTAAACAVLMAKYKGRPCGTFGAAAAFSFYPSKNLGAYGDGGAALTNSADLDERLRKLRNYGEETRYHHVCQGFNSRLDEIQAAILSVKLVHLDAWNDARRAHAKLYGDVLEGLPLRLPSEAEWATHCYHLYVIRSPQRDALREHLQAEGIATQLHYPVPVHLQEAYAFLDKGPGSFPQSEQAASEVLSLPMYPELTSEEIAQIGRAVEDFYS
ncbi:MAG: DegT/DnrJ/EryC1/StrS family aminotransferase [Candidatus Hydrogenedentes bacterium]|nr:DegT/DnrJ/EryC1/StrS family aminotransferase [Candidatus Hydrogenedentota bacterium]